MEAIKFIWGENDRFDTIREKAVELIGSKVINKENEKLPYTIFSVSEVGETVLECIGVGCTKVNMWSFTITYGLEDSGRRIEQAYMIMIPRKYGYEKDLKKCGIVVDIAHPFIFYKLNHLAL